MGRGVENNLPNKNSGNKNAERIGNILNPKKINIQEQEQITTKPNADNTPKIANRLDPLSGGIRPQAIQYNSSPHNEDFENDEAQDNKEDEGQPTDTEAPFGTDLNNYDPNKIDNISGRTKDDLAGLKNDQLGTKPENDTYGGPAQQASAGKEMNKEKEAGSQEKNNSNVASKDYLTKGKELGNKIAGNTKDVSKKVAQAAAKATTQVLVKIFASPWGIAIIAILLAIIIIVALFSIYSNSSSPSPTGKSTPQQVDPVADKEWISKVLALTGDTEVSKIMTDDFLKKLKTDLDSIKTEISANTGFVAAIDAIIKKIDAAAATPLKDAARIKQVTEIKNDISAAIGSLYSTLPVAATIDTRMPLKVNIQQFNTHPHLGTAGWTDTKKPTGYPSPARTFLQTGAGTCDAVDLKVGGNVDVYAAFSGKITKTSGAPSIEDSTNKLLSVYGHIDLVSGLSEGSSVRSGDLIGKTQAKEGHLHFELAIGDNNNKWKCVVSTPDEIRAEQAKGWIEHQVGKSLWAKMLLVLHSPKLPGE